MIFKGKDVFVATLKKCLDIKDNKILKSRTIDLGVILIKFEENDYRSPKDLQNNNCTKLTRKEIKTIKMRSLSTTPSKAGDIYITNIKPYYTEFNKNTRLGIKELIEIEELQRGVSVD